MGCSDAEAQSRFDGTVKQSGETPKGAVQTNWIGRACAHEIGRIYNQTGILRAKYNCVVLIIRFVRFLFHETIGRGVKRPDQTEKAASLAAFPGKIDT